MKKVLVLMVAVVLQHVAQAKITYIPSYSNYLHIISGGDTVAVTNNLDTLELVDPEGMFVMMIDQEDVTKEKVKAIKRFKRAAGWAGFAAVMSGVSTAFSSNSLQYMVRSTNTKIATMLADIYTYNANEAQTLEINLWIENTTDGELMVNDMERGLTWYILPRQSLKLCLNNPEAACLRISDPQSHYVRYASALVGSKLTRCEIDLETEEYWYIPIYRPNTMYKIENLLKYVRIDKSNYAAEEISVDDFKKIKKEQKNKK